MGKDRHHTAARLAAAALAVALLAVSPATGVEIPFATLATVSSTSLGAQAPGVADIDGDGDLDLISVGRNDQEVVWWEMTFSGLFLKRAVNDTTTDPFNGAIWVAAGDVDGDGDLDLVAAAEVDNDIAWWENDGTTGFWTKRTIDSAFDGARHVAPVDMDLDGDLDVLGAGFLADTVAWWENDGSPLDGGAEAGGEWTQHDIDVAFDGAFFAVPFDLDEDGDPDVVGVASVDDDIAWWENDGSPLDGGWTDRTVAASFDDVRAVRVADLDADGDPDLVAAAWGQDQVGWLENDTGDPTTAAWTPRGAFGASFGGAFGLRVADMDLDGDVDIVAAGETESEVAWFENDGTPANGGWTRRLVEAFTGARGVAVADLDGDGDPDVVGASSSGSILGWWENDTIHRSALLVAEADVASGIAGVPEIVEAADLDGDGDPDLLTDGSLVYRENDGAAAGWTARTISASVADAAAAGDLDGDGDLDVAGSVAGDIVWWENDGTPADGAWTQRLIDDDLPNQIVTAVVVADVDRDSDLDVLAADLALVADGGVLAWWENDGTPGDGGWTEHVIEDDSLTDPRDVAVADIDGDGHLDLVASAQNDSAVSWWQNDGTPRDGGAEMSGNWTEILVTGALGPSGTGAGDIDRDGTVDVLVTDAFGNIYLRRNTNGDGMTWGNTTIEGADGSVAAGDLETADVDLDGDLDLLFTQGNDQRVAWLEHPDPLTNNWDQVDLTTAFASVKSVVAADFDGDGDPDVAAIGGTGGAGRIAFWRNRGGQFALETTDTAPANLAAGADDDLLKIVAIHRGRSGDSDVELTSIELLLETADGVPLGNAEADALLSSLEIYLDDGSDAYDGADTPVAPAATPPFSLTAGRLTIAFADGDANVQVAHGSPATYFVVATAAVSAAGSLRVNHLTETSSSAEDAAADIPLTLELAADVTSGDVIVGSGPTCNLLSLAAVGNGAVPVASPDTSVGCAAGEVAPNVPVSLTATPDPGYVVTAWSGTDDDASTATANTLTMPASATAVTVTYGLAFDLVLADESFAAAAVREACNSITASGGVIVEVAGALTLRAPGAVVLESDVTVNGELTVDLATPAECP